MPSLDMTFTKQTTTQLLIQKRIQNEVPLSSEILKKLVAYTSVLGTFYWLGTVLLLKVLRKTKLIIY